MPFSKFEIYYDSSCTFEGIASFLTEWYNGIRNLEFVRLEIFETKLQFEDVGDFGILFII